MNATVCLLSQYDARMVNMAVEIVLESVNHDIQSSAFQTLLLLLQCFQVRKKKRVFSLLVLCNLMFVYAEFVIRGSTQPLTILDTTQALVQP